MSSRMPSREPSITVEDLKGGLAKGGLLIEHGDTFYLAELLRPAARAELARTIRRLIGTRRSGSLTGRGQHRLRMREHRQLQRDALRGRAGPSRASHLPRPGCPQHGEPGQFQSVVGEPLPYIGLPLVKSWPSRCRSAPSPWSRPDRGRSAGRRASRKEAASPCFSNLSGFALGCVYSLVALGYHITCITSRTLNFAQGSAMMLGAVITLMLVVDFGWLTAPAAIVAILLLGVFGFALERWPCGLSCAAGDGLGDRASSGSGSPSRTSPS